MPSNQTLLQKADLALADLSTNGGLLNPEQANTFIRKLIKEPTLIRSSRVVTMTTSQRKINKIQFGKRILRKGVQSVALANAAIEGVFDPVAEAAARAKPTTEQIVLNTDEVIAEVLIPYDVMEDNIESALVASNEASNTGPGGLRATIITLIAERAALDLEELGLLGDISLGAADDYLAMTDGWIKNGETNGNIEDASGATISKTIFKNGMKTMPDQYMRNRALLRHFVSLDNHIEYADTLADRGTALGDSKVQGTSPLMAYGVMVESVALMPEAKGIFCNPLNLIMGIQRQVSLEYDKDISTRVYKIVLTARVAFQIEEAEALVIYNNIAT